MIRTTDFLVLGSGIAGLTFALRMAEFGSVTVLTKKEGRNTSTNLAQGGIAAVMSPLDTFESHVKDTLAAGAGLCNEKAVWILVKEGPGIVRDLIDWGVQFTLDREGDFDLHREGGHTRSRILHARDLTGREIERALLDQLRRHPRVTVHEHTMGVDLWTAGEGDARRCIGALTLNCDTNEVVGYLARMVLLATGGLGLVYLHTTNPPIATGDGVAMAYRIGARIANMEFVQFHPTTLYDTSDETFLISEAVRGDGGILRLTTGETFMENYHEMGCLAPRDVVARAIDREMKRTGTEYVYLDVTHRDPAELYERFPTIAAHCRERGIDIAHDMIPVVPSAHYACGGVMTDLNGETNIHGLYATGEVACTGVHGANRLASNSLLEAVVFSERASKRVSRRLDLYPMPDPSLAPRDVQHQADHPEFEPVIINHCRQELQRLMWDYVGIVRTNDRLRLARRRLDVLRREIQPLAERGKLHAPLTEVWNMLQVAELVVRSALRRKESRGLHFNADLPDPVRSGKARNTVLYRRV